MLSIGSIIGLSFLAIGVATIVAAVVLAKRKRAQRKAEKRESWRSDPDFIDRHGAAPFVAAGGAFVVIIALLSLMPFAPPYLILEQHTGTVTNVEQRIITTGSDSSVKLTKELAFRLEGEDKSYITNDVRFNSLKPGDVVDVRRQLRWIYGGEDYWDVTYNGVITAPAG